MQVLEEGLDVVRHSVWGTARSRPIVSQVFQVDQAAATSPPAKACRCILRL